jgi:hypothetical protein
VTYTEAGTTFPSVRRFDLSIRLQNNFTPTTFINLWVGDKLRGPDAEGTYVARPRTDGGPAYEPATIYVKPLDREPQGG